MTLNLDTAEVILKALTHMKKILTIQAEMIEGLIKIIELDKMIENTPIVSLSTKLNDELKDILGGS